MYSIQDWLLPNACGPQCEGLLLNLAASAIWALIAYLSYRIIKFAVWLLAKKRVVFVSIPMAGLASADDFNAMKLVAAEIKTELERDGWARVYCAYDQVDVPGNYPGTARPSFEVFTTIWKCDYFLAVLPRRAFSSSLVEIGYALGRKKPVTIAYFSDNGRDAMPYLLENLTGPYGIGLKL